MILIVELFCDISPSVRQGLDEKGKLFASPLNLSLSLSPLLSFLLFIRPESFSVHHEIHEAPFLVDDTLSL